MQCPLAPTKCPDFDDNADATRSIAEDAAIGAIVGSPVRATDPNADDGGKLTYTLTGTDASSFKINKMTGQITVNAVLDNEKAGGPTYSVTANVFDPSNDDDEFVVTITATDVNEAPSVALVAGVTETLSVPENHALVADGDRLTRPWKPPTRWARTTRLTLMSETVPMAIQPTRAR